MKKLFLFLSIIFFFGNNNNVFGQDDNAIYEVVDKKAEFPGGYIEFQKFVTKTYEYPKKLCIMGTSILQFVVEKDSTVSNIKIFKDLHPKFEAEAIRVVKLTKWIPATYKGKIVRNRIIVPIKVKY